MGVKLPWAGPSAFDLPLGTRIRPGSVAGYYIDMSDKAETPSWPPDWFPWPGYHRFIAIGQWALGAHERFLRGDGAEWIAAATAAGEFLLGAQSDDGTWYEEHGYHHTFHMRGPWSSAMAQGQCASLLVRLHLATGRTDFADAARRALSPLTVETAEGGLYASLDGRVFPEEYPTKIPSFVLNGAIFASWGWYDVGIGLHDGDARDRFLAFVELLADDLWRWDTGYWSRYDLYPHPVVNVASTPYHRLHIQQLQAMHLLAPRDEFVRRIARFEGYEASRLGPTRAMAHKALFRILIPRNRRLSGRFPWDHAQQAVIR